MADNSVMLRTDVSTRLVHMTKGTTEQDAVNRFLSIVGSAQIRGGTGFIRGGYRCVCFTEAPIANLAQALAQPSPHGIPYAPLGVMIDKTSCFQLGGRPVIYQSEAEFALLPEALRFRHKRYEPPGIDWTWEREWRIHGDYVLHPSQVTLIVPSRAWASLFFDAHSAQLQSSADHAVMVSGLLEIPWTASIESCPWHFIALDDLGIGMDFVRPATTT